MKIIIFEGARGVGKSTIVAQLRYQLNQVISMNLTGNKEDSIEGRDRVYNHFMNLHSFFKNEQAGSSPFTYILDRFYFSELVYSNLYKQNYSFQLQYDSLQLATRELIEDGVELVVVHVVANEKRLKSHLRREGKAALFGKGDLADTVQASLKQQEEYEKMFSKAPKWLKPSILKFDVSGYYDVNEMVEALRNKLDI